MSYDSSDVLASLFASATIRSPMPSTSSASSPRPTLAHSKSIGAEPTTPRSRPSMGKRLPRRSVAASLSTSTTPVPVQYQHRKGGSVSPPQHSHHRDNQLQQLQPLCESYAPFAGAKFSESPSARAIPLPPTIWFEDDEESSLCAPSDTESVSSSSSSSSSDSLPLSTSSSLHDESGNLVGIRVNPLQLIAAVSAL